MSQTFIENDKRHKWMTDVMQVSSKVSKAYNDFEFEKPQTSEDCNYKIERQGVLYKQLLVNMRRDVNGQGLFGALNSDQTLISWDTTPVTYWHSPKTIAASQNVNSEPKATQLLEQPEIL